MKRDIRDQIEDLKREIDTLPDSAAPTQEHFRQVLDEIEENLEAEDEPALTRLIGSIEETVERFEVEHPRATAILNDIMVKLSSMGI